MKKHCESCQREFEGRRDAKFCGATCRKRGSRVRGAGSGAEVVPLPTKPAEPPSEAPLVAAIEKQLAAADRLMTPAGQMALLLARRLAAGLDTGSAQAALVREVTSQLDDALAGAKLEPDAMDELAARRDRKAIGA